ncbi:MAG: carotenoid oxygenase family protein, partial [Gammaproteobacteria bacterium]|nr:carotenoid oxygenase family protein [Gammaproteobacteria bacterium]
FDETKNATDLVILDAQDLSRPALAEVHLPVRVPYGFHGNWVPDSITAPA